MSLREEDRAKNGSSKTAGFGLAAAALGFGVGAALYYFFSKRPENPAGEGSTQSWTCVSPHTLQDELTDSYTTISENTTTDTSIAEDLSDRDSSTVRVYDQLHVSSDDADVSFDDADASFDDADATFDDADVSFDDADVSFDDADVTYDDSNSGTDDEDSVRSNCSSRVSSGDVSTQSDMTDSNEWDASMTLDLPDYRPVTSSPLHRLVHYFSLQSPTIMKSRERSWSLEECSICFEVILRDHEVMTLPCTHHFHQACILPWLQEQQTCPNCRKSVD